MFLMSICTVEGKVFTEQFIVVHLEMLCKEHTDLGFCRDCGRQGEGAWEGRGDEMNTSYLCLLFQYVLSGFFILSLTFCFIIAIFIFSK